MRGIVRGLWAATFIVAFSAACSEPSTSGGPLPAWEPTSPSKPIELPDGFVIEAELKTTPAERARGMMFRPAMPEDKGMLFIFPDMQPQGFWMYNTLVSLDIIWLDDNKRVVDISANTPPCGSIDARDCRTYGGSVSSVYVLEIGAGQAAKHRLEIGSILDF